MFSLPSRLPIAVSIGLTAVITRSTSAISAPYPGTNGLPPSLPLTHNEPIYNVVFSEDGSGIVSLVKTEKEPLENAAAWGRYWETYNHTGWSVLDLHTSEKLDTNQQSFAAGFLEGTLTGDRMKDYLTNVWTIDFDWPKAPVSTATSKNKGGKDGKTKTKWHGTPGTPQPGIFKLPPSVMSWMQATIDWMTFNSQKNKNEPYWDLAGGLVSQLFGLTAGYNNAAEKRGDVTLGELDIYAATLIDTEMEDIMKAIQLDHGRVKKETDKTTRRDGREVNADGLIIPEIGEFYRRWRHRQSHCSVLINLGENNEDLYTTHAEWDGYRAMMKVARYIDMPLKGAKTRKMAFPGNFGSLYSAEDFYNLDSGLTVVETTIENDNEDLVKKYVKPDTMPAWARPMLANRLATNGDEWTEIHSRYGSGTCNNGWIVVDYKRFIPGEKNIQDGLIWTEETMPGYTRRADVTDVLRKNRQWAAYNIPYFKDLRKLSMESVGETDPNANSYTQCPRAKMFSRVQGKVTSLNKTFETIRYNNWPEDPLTLGNPCKSIAARCDLNPKDSPHYSCFGETNSKTARYRKDWKNDLSFFGILSPSYDNQKVYVWSEQNKSVDGCIQPRNMPDRFDFPWWTFPKSLAEKDLDGVLFIEESSEDGVAVVDSSDSIEPISETKVFGRPFYLFFGGMGAALSLVGVAVLVSRVELGVGEWIVRKDGEDFDIEDYYVEAPDEF